MMRPRNKMLVTSLEGNLVLFDTITFSQVQSQFFSNVSQCRGSAWSAYSSTFAIAQQHRICGYDARNNRFCYSIPFEDVREIRSVSAEDSYRVTFTTGSGCLVFGDVRMQKVLPLEGIQNSSPTATIGASVPNSLPMQMRTGQRLVKNGSAYQLIGGHVTRNDFYTQNFAPWPVEHALFTHCYDPSGMRIFVGGGPSLAHLEGCNSAIIF